MIRVHVIRWVCGKAVFVWQWMSDTQADKLPHLTSAMIHHREVVLLKKMVIIGCVGLAPAVPPVVYYGPGIVRGVFLGPPVAGFSPIDRSGQVSTPEPGMLSVFIAGFGWLVLLRRSRRNSAGGQ